MLIMRTKKQPENYEKQVKMRIIAPRSGWSNKSMKVNHVNFTYKLKKHEPIIINNTCITNNTTAIHLGINLDVWSTLKRKDMNWALSARKYIASIEITIKKLIWIYGIQLWGWTAKN